YRRDRGTVRDEPTHVATTKQASSRGGAMSIRVLADGADGFALFSPRGHLVGWIRGRAIGVAGFIDEPTAISAALHANRVLSEWLERNGLQPLAKFGDSV